MRVTHRIDIVLFHQADVLLHQFLTDSTSLLRVFVPVDAFHQYRNTVDTETTVLYFRSTETYLATGYFGQPARSILQLKKQRIKIGMFCTPCFHCRKLLIRESDEIAQSTRLHRNLFRQYHFTFLIFQRVRNRRNSR